MGLNRIAMTSPAPGLKVDGKAAWEGTAAENANGWGDAAVIPGSPQAITDPLKALPGDSFEADSKKSSLYDCSVYSMQGASASKGLKRHLKHSHKSLGTISQY